MCSGRVSGELLPSEQIPRCESLTETELAPSARGALCFPQAPKKKKNKKKKKKKESTQGVPSAWRFRDLPCPPCPVEEDEEA